MSAVSKKLEIPRVLILSNISLGRGVPQLKYLSESLIQLGASAVMVVEPDEEGAAEIEIDGVEICREITLLPPNHPSFAIVYIEACREHIDDFRPDIIVVTSGFMVMALTTASHRSSRVIYYAFEDKSRQVSIPPYSSAMLCDFMAAHADTILVPDQNRAEIDYPQAMRDKKVIIVFNVSSLSAAREEMFFFDEERYLELNPDVAEAVAQGIFNSGCDHYKSHGCHEGRSVGRRLQQDCYFLFAGTLDRRSLLDVFFDPALEDIRVDIYGVPSDEDAEEIIRKICKLHSGVQYKGLISNTELRRISVKYSYRMVFWSDGGLDELFACPNEFFEALADGVPVVATPQSQIYQVISTWGCGLLTEDWSVSAVSTALQQARGLYETEIYDQLVLNAKAASKTLNWQTEFNKISSLFVLPASSINENTSIKEGFIN